MSFPYADFILKFSLNDGDIVGEIWRLSRKINTKKEPLIIGLKKVKEGNSSPLVCQIKENGIEII